MAKILTFATIVANLANLAAILDAVPKFCQCCPRFCHLSETTLKIIQSSLQQSIFSIVIEQVQEFF